MAYDKDSNIGQQIANPSNPQIGQMVIHEQKLTSIPVLESKITSMPVLESKATSIPVLESKTTSMSVMESKATSLPVMESKTTSMQLQNTARQIDLLSMEQFGQNIVKLRKGLSITDATQVNTDKEYGIMQIEDDFSFNTIIPIAIAEDETSFFTYYAHTIRQSNIGTSFTSLTTINIPTQVYNEILPTQVISRANDKIGNVFYLNNSTSSSTIKANADTLSESSVDSGNLSGSSLLYDVVGWSDFTGAAKFITVVFRNNSSVDTDVMKVKIGTSEWTANKGEQITAHLHAGTGFIGEGAFVKYNNSEWIPIIYQSQYEVRQFKLNLNTFEVANGITLSGTTYNGFSNVPIFESSILGMIGNGVTEYKQTITISASTTLSVKPWKVRISSSESNIMDYSFFNYFYGLQDNAKLVLNVNPISIDTDEGFAIARVSGDPKLFCYYVTNELLGYSNPLDYYLLVEVSNNISIGLISRSNGTASLSVKIDNKYYTANGDAPYRLTSMIIKSLNIVEIGSFGVSFTVEINGTKLYYSAKRLFDYDGGPLLDNYSGEQVLFTCTQLNVEYDKKIISSNIAGVKSVYLSSFTCDSNIYKKTTKPNVIRISEKAIMSAGDYNGLGQSYLIMNDIIDYVIKGICIPIMCGSNYLLSDVVTYYNYSNIEGMYFLSIYKLPTLGTVDLGYPYNTLPLRLVDEFPEISNGGELCDSAFNLGKTKFVSNDGNLYETGTLSLVANKEKLYLSETGIIYFSSGYFFLAKSNLTNVYTFTELGLQLLFAIEDEVICNPVKISIGILACGKRGIWNVTQEGVKLIWTSTGITQASLKTDLDNSCIAVLDESSTNNSQLRIPFVGTDIIEPIQFSNLGITGGSLLQIGTVKFTVITINQFGYISSQEIDTGLTSASFIDIGATSDLIVIDTAGMNTISTIGKVDADNNDYYYIQSNQNVEYYEQTVYSELVKVKVFAMGTGTIELYINGSSVETVTLSSVTRYTEYSFNVNSVALSMLDYKFKVLNGVKMLQRIIGVIIPKEEYYG
jgi:hypothetical protein